MTRRTSLNLDFDLVARAKDVLGTTATTETIHEALREVVRQARIRRLAAHRFDMTPDQLEQLRAPRTASASSVAAEKRSSGAR
jgi:hypothetical protein